MVRWSVSPNPLPTMGGRFPRTPANVIEATAILDHGASRLDLFTTVFLLVDLQSFYGTKQYEKKKELWKKKISR